MNCPSFIGIRSNYCVASVNQSRAHSVNRFHLPPLRLTMGGNAINVIIPHVHTSRTQRSSHAANANARLRLPLVHAVRRDTSEESSTKKQTSSTRMFHYIEIRSHKKIPRFHKHLASSALLLFRFSSLSFDP